MATTTKEPSTYTLFLGGLGTAVSIRENGDAVALLHLLLGFVEHRFGFGVLEYTSLEFIRRCMAAHLQIDTHPTVYQYLRPPGVPSGPPSQTAWVHLVCAPNA